MIFVDPQILCWFDLDSITTVWKMQNFTDSVIMHIDYILSSVWYLLTDIADK